MRTAREVIAEAIGQVDPDIPRYQDAGEFADAALAALRAEGLVIVAAADVEVARDACERLANDAGEQYEANCYPSVTPGNTSWLTEHQKYRAVEGRFDAALAAGGTDGH